MTRRNPKQKLITALAQRWARRHGQHYHPMGRGLRVGTLSRYMRNWLTQHGELPTGVHTVTVRPGNHGGTHVSATIRFQVDFDALYDHSEPPVPVS